jgi:SAM-dependent methyltransferase
MTEPTATEPTATDGQGACVEAVEAEGPTEAEWVSKRFGPPPPHPARIYDHWLGGKDNFEADRRIGEQIAELAPWVRSGARGNRSFLTRAVTYLAQAGVDQFIDVGAGLPGTGNVHEVAQRINPRARTVYVDNDEIVLVHARALLATDARTIVVGGDVRDPQAILADPAVCGHLDLARPVAALFLAVLHFIRTDEDPQRIVAAFRDVLTPGSFLAISHVADLPSSLQDPDRAAVTREAANLYEALVSPFTLRSPEQIECLFAGFDFVSPGLVPAHLWRPTRERPGPPIPILAGVGRLCATPISSSRP